MTVAFDSYMYSPKGQLKFVSSVFNLLDYNIMNDKSDLYGTEPRSFYMKNLALNFQLTGVFAQWRRFPCSGGGHEGLARTTGVQE